MGKIRVEIEWDNKTKLTYKDIEDGLAEVFYLDGMKVFPLPPENHAGEKVGLPEKIHPIYSSFDEIRKTINDLIDYLSQKEDSHE